MSDTTADKSTIVAILGDIFVRRGAESYLGEDVSMAEHMLQAAALAERDGARTEMIAAALLHDIGHFGGEFGTYSPDDTHDRHHDATGGDILKPFFPPLVSKCVRLHVTAKRYLCAKDRGYFDKLSSASVHTLSLQGGPMSEQEVRAFEMLPYHKEAVKVRLWDDTGKVAGVQTKTFGDYADLLQDLVNSHTR